MGDRLSLRFVPLDGDEIERNTLRCLQKIHCSERTPRHLPDDMREAVYAAWEQARKDIYDEWMFATDPLNIQPKIRPLFRRAANHIREHPPPGYDQQQIDEAIEAIEAPWGMRHERILRNVLEGEGGESSSDSAEEISVALMQKVQELGLQPFIQPEPLPVIDEDEIHLICWMAVDE